MLNGVRPSTEPFSIVSPEALSRIEDVLNDKFLVKRLTHGFLIIKKDNGCNLNEVD